MIPFFRCSKILGEAGKQENLQNSRSQIVLWTGIFQKLMLGAPACSMHKWTNSLRVTKFRPQIIKFLYNVFSITDKTQLKWHQLYETRNSKEGMTQTLVWKWTFNICVKQLLNEHNNIIIFTVISEYYCFIKKKFEHFIINYS